MPKRVTPVAATLDGENGFGFVIGTRAMHEAIAMAREFGIGVVSARRSTHFGMAASYAILAIEAGLMAMVFSNASQAMPPWGSKQMLLGTNPFCMAAPAGKHRPVILDMSPAVAARGKIRRAERRGETIPLGYALDAGGRPTTDPKAALAGGVVLPIGEHKGSGIAMFMDIFGGVISGANFGGDVGDQYKSFDRAQDVGHFFLAMKPDLFVSEDDYRARIDALIDRMKAAPLRRRICRGAGAGRARGPPSRPSAAHAGIPYAASEVKALQDEAKRAGIQPLVDIRAADRSLMDRPMIDSLARLRQFAHAVARRPMPPRPADIPMA